MKQILQNLSTGETELVEVPVPQISSGHLMIRTTSSLISTGTERMLVEFGKSNLINKARQQPEKVRQVADKILAEGLFTTIDSVRSKLDQPLRLGYSNVGVVLNASDTNFQVGDRVVSNGPHAELVNVPINLCAKIPENVTDEEASFTVVASIGLQGIRLAKPTLGECFVIIGVGLIGLLCVQILRAHGCKVLAIDLDEKKLKLAQRYGAETCNLSTGVDPVNAAMSFSNGVGIDGVLITASTKSNEPITQAARMCRKRGRIVMVGVTGMTLNRSDFYEKELMFQVSCSYGPGRYDENYENKGQDYPIAFVRWTEQRNFEAVLDLMANKVLDVTPLVAKKFDFNEAAKAYEKLSIDKNSLAIILTYPQNQKISKSEIINLNIPNNNTIKLEYPRFGLIGAGNYANRTLASAFKSAKVELKMVASARGTNAATVGKRWGFDKATSDVKKLLHCPEIDMVAIATQHDSHASLTVQALEANKHVFVEKPLALTLMQLESIKKAYTKTNVNLLVGFNRRFAPQVKKMHSLLKDLKQPKNLIMTVNAGVLPPDHWHNDRKVGGGRFLSEGCHFIDLLRYLVGAPIKSFSAHANHENGSLNPSQVTANLSFEDGSSGTIFYLDNGHRSFPKEQLDIFCAGRILRLNNFRLLQGWGWPNFKRNYRIKQDKGHQDCAIAFVNSIKNGTECPIPVNEIMEVSRVTIEISREIYGNYNYSNEK